MAPINFTGRAQLLRRQMAEFRPELRGVVLSRSEEALRDRLEAIGVNPEVAAIFAFGFVSDVAGTG